MIDEKQNEWIKQKQRNQNVKQAGRNNLSVRSNRRNWRESNKWNMYWNEQSNYLWAAVVDDHIQYV